MQELTVLVTTWNNGASIQRCLEAVQAWSPGSILLCDCGSIDATLEIVQREFSPPVRILNQATAGSRRLSFARARNLGLKHASTPWLLMIDGDWEADRSCILRLAERLKADPSVAIAVPRFRDGFGVRDLQIGHNVRRFPTSAPLCRELLLLHKLLGNDPATRRYRMLDFDHAHDCVVDYACGAFILVNREALLRIGGYDERYAPAWMEDVDLSQRLVAAGRKTLFCADATAQHIGRETTRHFVIEARYHEFYRSLLRYARNYLGRSWQLVRVSLILGLAAKIGFAYALPVGCAAIC